MDDQVLTPSYRRTTRTDLYRVTDAFRIGTDLVDTGTALHIFRKAEASTLFLDADVVTGWVGLAPTPKAPYFGTRWVMQNNDDGTWSFLNQGQEEHQLAGAADTVTLGRPPALEGMERFATTRWLIYHDLTGFRLRPCMRATGWLGVRDERLVLSGRDEVAGPWLYWGIMPLPAEPVSETEILA